MERAPGHRAGLTRAAVVGAARELLSERGLTGLSMRALAARLDVAPNALYSHVASKTALLDAVLDDVLAEVDTPTEDGDPAEGLQRLMTSTYTVLLDHADLVPLYLSRQGAHGPNAQRLGEITAALLRRAEVAEPAVPEALRVLIVYTIGFAAFTRHLPPGAGTERQPSAAEMRGNFDRGLGWLLTGIRVQPDRRR
ncbi:TetR/AcrR family transcriptional regulator [Amycolatopsis thermalba]|uniref:TetR/AcrR family transcriptional regulator n=1 Tax=Amycolatopsis thermalba TaxID=944492 RepID=A0ABY4P1B3_9PSEU|nr:MULTISPECIES: TetR/AcrR family transcriptional regulator [Amycolatopsis]UQS26130.1 TetR/AcrR family transcriptional regulator [Amycolatopsis thermalba]